MAGFDHQPERAWDEYDWERFLQQQDHKTEKYMELLEKYLDDPNRDQIIAREMGWTQLLEGHDWTRKSTPCLKKTRRRRHHCQIPLRSTVSIEAPLPSRSGSITCSIRIQPCKTSRR